MSSASLMDGEYQQTTADVQTCRTFKENTFVLPMTLYLQERELDFHDKKKGSYIFRKD